MISNSTEYRFLMKALKLSKSTTAIDICPSSENRRVYAHNILQYPEITAIIYICRSEHSRSRSMAAKYVNKVKWAAAISCSCAARAVTSRLGLIIRRESNHEASAAIEMTNHRKRWLFGRGSQWNHDSTWRRKQVIRLGEAQGEIPKRSLQ